MRGLNEVNAGQAQVLSLVLEQRWLFTKNLDCFKLMKRRLFDTALAKKTRLS